MTAKAEVRALIEKRHAAAALGAELFALGVAEAGVPRRLDNTILDGEGRRAAIAGYQLARRVGAPVDTRLTPRDRRHREALIDLYEKVYEV